MAERIRMGMVGGGSGAFIGAVHRLAAEMTGAIDLVAGAFSSDANASRDFGIELGLDERRSYGSYEQMFEAEAALPENERIQCVSIVTPNNSHADIACMALERGMHVICDKPLAGTLEDAERVAAAVEKTGLLFGITHTYTGYPLVIEARERVRAGELGNIRRIVVIYLQDWLSNEDDTKGSKQATWRTDSSIGGESGAFADIGTHAFNLVEFISGQQMTEVAAELKAVVSGRDIDDDGAAMFRMENGASGLLAASQVCTGAVNGLRIEVYGDKGSLHWAHGAPNSLTIGRRGEPDQVLQPGNNIGYLSDAAIARCRTPGGHPEGFIEAFSNLYVDFANAVCEFPEPVDNVCATVGDGVRAMRFVRATISSTNNGSQWTPV
ncbi:MAG: Gfo/Idh/MocA family protein [Woeseiaceae bacterium]